MGIASLILGIVGLFAWTLPVVGFPISMTGLYLGVMVVSQEKPHRRLAVSGLIMCIVEIVLIVIYFICIAVGIDTPARVIYEMLL